MVIMYANKKNPALRPSLLIFLTVLLAPPALGAPLQCPQFCYCINTFVTCSDFSYLDLTVIPQTTETLVLTKGEVEEIPPAFLATAPNLRILEIVSVQVRVLRGSAFIGLNKLELLTITGSRFDIVEPDSFSGISEVNKFEITDSKFGRLGKHAFGHISNISDFNIWSNSFEDFSSEAFVGLNNISRFQILRNNITRIGSGIFKDATGIRTVTFYQNKIERIETGSLEKLAQISERMVFKDNIFRCTCQLSWILLQPELDEFLDSNECSFTSLGLILQPEELFSLADINKGVLCPAYQREETYDMTVLDNEDVVSDTFDIHQHAIVPYFDEKFDVMDDEMEDEEDLASAHAFDVMDEVDEFGEMKDEEDMISKHLMAFKELGFDDMFDIDDSYVEIESDDMDMFSEDRDELLQRSTSTKPQPTEQQVSTTEAGDDDSMYKQEIVGGGIKTEDDIKRDDDKQAFTQETPKYEFSTYGQAQIDEKARSIFSGEVTTEKPRYADKDMHSTANAQAEDSNGDDVQIVWNEHILYASPASDVTERPSTSATRKPDDVRNTHKTENGFSGVTDRTSFTETTSTTTGPSTASVAEDEGPATIVPMIETFDLDISHIFDEDYQNGPWQPEEEVASKPTTTAGTATTTTLFTQPIDSATRTVGRYGQDQAREDRGPAIRGNRWNHRTHHQSEPERFHSQADKDSASTSIPASLLLVVSLVVCLLGKH